MARRKYRSDGHTSPKTSYTPCFSHVDGRLDAPRNVRIVTRKANCGIGARYRSRRSVRPYDRWSVPSTRYLVTLATLQYWVHTPGSREARPPLTRREKGRPFRMATLNSKME
jgi:hypothetical protein